MVVRACKRRGYLGRPARVAAMGAALVVSGCGSPHIWDRPGVTVAQATADQKDCRETGRRDAQSLQGYSDGTVAGAAGAGVATGVGRAIASNNNAEACLAARGYVRTPISAEELSQARSLEGEQRDAYNQQLLDKYGSDTSGAAVAAQPKATGAPAGQ